MQRTNRQDAPVPESIFIDAVEQVVKPTSTGFPDGSRSDVRPTIADGKRSVLGVSPAPSYLFMVYVTPVGPYLRVECVFHRLAHSEMNFIELLRAVLVVSKRSLCSGHDAKQLAKAQGYAEIIYLDAKTSTYVEELGLRTSSSRTVSHTPELTGTILPGITRTPSRAGSTHGLRSC